MYLEVEIWMFYIESIFSYTVSISFLIDWGKLKTKIGLDVDKRLFFRIHNQKVKN